jgi:signal transduction histidine kinase
MQQMLVFTRVSSPNKKTLDFGRILKNSVIIAIGESPVTAEFAWEREPLLCEADERQMAQVINILVTNAIQAMPAGGTLAVSAGNLAVAPGEHYALAGGEYCRIIFADSGTGIAAEDLPHIFDPFFTTKSQCSGLGLPTAYAIMKYHGGFIEALPVQGAGASFALYLPLTSGAA